MMNLIKVITNELENNRLETEDALDRILNSKEYSLEEKKNHTIKLLGEIAIAEISNNLWQSYINRPEPEAPHGEPQPQHEPQPTQNPPA